MARAGPKRTRQYGVAFKRTAVLLSQRPGMQVQAVAEALDIHPFMPSRWRKEFREGRLRLPMPVKPGGPKPDSCARFGGCRSWSGRISSSRRSTRS